MSKMTDVKKLITEHLDIWLTAETDKKSGRGRSSSSANSIYGVQKLRELILELAVIGRLTCQNKADDAKTEFLKLAQEAKKLQLSENFKTLEHRPQQISLGFETPQNWHICLFDEIAAIARGGSPRPIKSFITDVNDIDGVNWIKIGDSERGSIYITSTSEKIRASGVTSSRMVYPDDLILSNSMSFGYPYIMGIEGCIHDGWLVIRTPSQINKLFLYYLLRSPYARKQFTKSAAGAVVQNLNADKVKELILPLPPLEEQQRIVEKVDELMQLCDQLEQKQNLSSEAHDQLVDTLLSVLINSFDVDEFQQNWQRISENFDLLFTTEYSVEQLKQTILQLAVMGKLVKQDPNDEPASELLEQIAEEKAKLVKEGKVKKTKPLPEIIEEEKPFESPDGWELTRLDTLVLESGAGWSPSCDPYPRVGDNWGVLKVSAVSWGSFDPLQNKSLPHELEPRVDIEVQNGDFLISRANTAELVAKSVIAYNPPKHLMLSDKIVRLKLTKFCSKEYINLCNKTEFTRSYYANVSGGTSDSMRNVSRQQILNLIIPLPPLNEQIRVVEKINQLFSMIEKLQTLQGKLQKTKLHLADSLVNEVLSDSNDKRESQALDNIILIEKPVESVKQSKQDSTDQIDLFTEESVDDDLKLLSLAAEITFQLHTEPTFGHLKLQKLIYLCQQLKHMDLAADFKQHAAGPYDPVMARYLDKEFKDREWFSYDPKRDVKYKPLTKCNEHRSSFNKYFAKETSDIYALVGLFRTSKSDHIEIVATLFACWLRLLERKLFVTEEQLLKDFYAWSQEKKPFSKAEVLNGYKWMKQNSVVPL